MITDCLNPSSTRRNHATRAVASLTVRTRKTTEKRHQLNGHLGLVPHLKSRKSFIKCTDPINMTAKASRTELWRVGAENPWTTSKALNRLRTQVGRSRVNMLKWGFSSEVETCDCGIRQTMQHLLVCPMMNTACSTQFDGRASSDGRARMMMMMMLKGCG